MSDPRKKLLDSKERALVKREKALEEREEEIEAILSETERMTDPVAGFTAWMKYVDDSIRAQGQIIEEMRIALAQADKAPKKSPSRDRKRASAKKATDNTPSEEQSPEDAVAIEQPPSEETTKADEGQEKKPVEEGAKATEKDKDAPASKEDARVQDIRDRIDRVNEKNAQADESGVESPKEEKVVSDVARPKSMWGKNDVGRSVIGGLRRQKPPNPIIGS